MATRIDDKYAAMTIEDGDGLFADLALLVIERDKIKADYEKKIAELKKKADAATESYSVEISTLEDQLSLYITAHPERFEKPRQRKTEFGKYGLRTVNKVDIHDEQSAIISAKMLDIPAVIVTEKLDKKALEKAIRDGAPVSGVEITQEDIASYTVTKALESDEK